MLFLCKFVILFPMISIEYFIFTRIDSSAGLRRQKTMCLRRQLSSHSYDVGYTLLCCLTEISWNWRDFNDKAVKSLALR